MLERSEAERFLEQMRTIRMAGDVEAAASLFDDDAVFTLVGMVAEVRGKPAIRQVLKSLIDDYEFLDWTPISLCVDGDEIAARHRLTFRHRSSGQIVDTESCEFLSMGQGRIRSFVQYADTAAITAVGRS